MALFLVPPSLGASRAEARAELLGDTLSLGRDAGEQVTVAVAADYEALERAVRSAEAELVWAPSAVCAMLAESPGRPVRAVLRAVRRGRSAYHSAIVARPDEGRSVDALRNVRAGWVDPLSAGGYLLAQSYLRQKGIEPNIAFSQQTFLGSHRAVIDALAEGQIDVGAVSAPSTDEEEVQAAMRFYAGRPGVRLAILAITEAIPNDALIVTAAMSIDDGERLAGALAPTNGRRAPSLLLTAMEADRLERTTLDDYRAVRGLLTSRRWSEPPRR